ncbi:uncharacterized protein TRIVIDRAFT_138817, partial [Trichoderma virens Gv29-8]
MYAKNTVAAQEGSGNNLLAPSNSTQANSIGGTGPHKQIIIRPLYPGLVKRLAYDLEIKSLRDKESQEARAKKICVQLAKEEGLEIEILDAELQSDWSRITFYYLDDRDTNVSSLITELYKVYKTHIAMSAIKPLSLPGP